MDWLCKEIIRCKESRKSWYITIKNRATKVCVFVYLLKLKTKSAFSSRSIFHRVDLHGADVTIVKAKNSSLVDITGIVLLETKNTFKILVKDDSIKGVFICVDTL